MYGDFKRWQKESRLLYDQIVGAFYTALTEEDHRWLHAMQIDPFGDNRPWANSGL
jgi:hypothetical protein